ncbi:hypothetical protein K504DRAFT_503917 [Pleomassaria siparia CBS 279.74]|uniref:Transcriptional regulatory protein DEP1 n=1 Tax=Pleomassaria siparia CBS 279.74 TaxID=1314801 RepID=A0A6G1K4L0_9PLEO|nr:hypothetical protein K504DRAFT_503917 [Pleomassaria siparia CBS 279.74]
MLLSRRRRGAVASTDPACSRGNPPLSPCTILISTDDQRDPSSTPSPRLSTAPATLQSPERTTTSNGNGKMLSTLSSSSLLTSVPQLDENMESIRNDLDDLPDNRSSSLSELGDASDDHSEPTPRAPTATDLVDPDSEAETERLETTPRKLTRTLTNTSIGSEQTYERNPSKLIHSKTIDEELSPTPNRGRDEIEGFPYTNPLEVPQEAEMLATLYKEDLAGLKRKRSSGGSSAVEEPTEEPARKRSSQARSPALNGSQEIMVESSEQINVEEALDNAEERISQLTQEGIELEERQVDVAVESVSELATVAKLTKPRKGGRRGKRKVDDTSHTSNEAIASMEVQDPEAEGDNDEDESGSRDEEVANKKNAIDELSKIEKKFKIFREKLCHEQIAQYEQELEMLKQPNCVHPEYLAMIKCIDERRDEKIAYEKTLFRYKQENLKTISAAEWHQLHSQYFQTVRDAKDKVLTDCNRRIYELQKGRRQLGVEEVEYMMKLPERRSEQIRHQAAYNLEVSIISGIAKYVGFPAAPGIRPARTSEIDDDLRAMKITTQPAAPPPYVRPYIRTSAADEAAAGEQFIERTPWANPQHPAHQQSHYAPASSRAASQTYQTPAAQRRMVDIHAPNGSGSTIDAASNPPSASNARIAEPESPVLQMKRHPNDHPPYSDTPVSHPRAFASLARESYASNSHMLPSPAPPHIEDEQDVRWGGGIRPLNAGAPGGPPGPPIPGRPDAVRVPLQQRSSLGTVSVGSGNGLFGR